MASPDKGAGPQVGQMVLWNNAGTIVPALIYAVSATGVVSLGFFTGGTTWTNVASANFSPALGTSTWNYMPFF